MSKKKKEVEVTFYEFGFVSMFGTFLVLLAVSLHLGTLTKVASDFWVFMRGDLIQVEKNQYGFLEMFPTIAAVVVLEIPCTLASFAIPGLLLKMPGKHAVSAMLDEMKSDTHFFKLFLIMAAEEVFARWYFLGYLANFPLLSGTSNFYYLFLVGNGLWALVHLYNFKEKKDRHVLRVIPQFVGGLFFTYVFVKHGLLGAIFAHFASNGILMASHKKQNLRATDLLRIDYDVISGVTSYLLMNKPLTDVLVWFSEKPTLQIEGWNVWDYLKCSIFISSCTSIIFRLLLYDRLETTSEEEKETCPRIIAAPFILMFLYCLYALLGVVISNVAYRILAITLLFTFTKRSKSGSGTVGIFWRGLPNLYILICTLQAITFWEGILFILVSGLFDIPYDFIREWEKKQEKPA